MYNLDGLYNYMLARLIIFALGAIIFLLSSSFWKKEKVVKQDLIASLVCVFLFLYCSISYKYYLKSFDVCVNEGDFVEERGRLIGEYVFTNDSPDSHLKGVYELDFITMKEVWPKGFEKNKKYRIYYDEKYKIILKVEEMN